MYVCVNMYMCVHVYTCIETKRRKHFLKKIVYFNKKREENGKLMDSVKSIATFI